MQGAVTDYNSNRGTTKVKVAAAAAAQYPLIIQARSRVRTFPAIVIMPKVAAIIRKFSSSSIN